MMPSVPGGTHWGGGMQIHAEDQARIGHLVLNRGRWGTRQVVPESWIAQSITPCPLNPSYGFLWWLNGNGRLPSAPRSSIMASGAGGNTTWIWPEREVVVVLRWVNPAQLDAVCARIVKAAG